MNSTRHELDREDLLRDAVGLVERVELGLGDDPTPVLAGFRAGGGFSVYFGPEFVLQFNAAGELRRAYLSNQLVKAERGCLVAMTRVRTSTAVRLESRPWTPTETGEFLARVQSELDRLRAALASQSYQRRGQVPQDGDVVQRLRARLDTLPVPPPIATRPHAG